MKRILTVIFLLIASIAVNSQSIEKRDFDIGLYGAMGFNIHNANFKFLPQYRSCCPNYESGEGIGLNFGVIPNFRVVDNMKIGLQLGYSDLSALITKEELKKEGFDNNPGNVSDGIIRHDLEVSLPSITIEPRITYSFLNDIYIYLGFGVNYLLRGDVSQKETLVYPTDVTFNNGRITRNETSGSIENLNKILPSLTLGGMLELPLTYNEDFYLSPFASYTQLFGNVTKDVDWTISNLKVGIQITHAFRKRKVEVKPKQRDTLIPPLPHPISSIIAEFEVKIKEDFSQDTIYKKYDKDLRFEAILGYVFFEENNSNIPSRYNLISTYEADKFTVDGLDFNNSLSGYHNVLNILGQRFKRNPEVKVDLIGCNSDFEIEKDNKVLSKNRAITIRDYFVNIWGLDSNRFNIIARNLPETPSSTENDFGREENRRVEIVPHDWGIFKPQLMSDTTESKSSNINLELVTDVNSALPIDNWKIAAKEGNSLINEFSGNGDVPKSQTWNTSTDSNLTMSFLKGLDYTLTVYDTLGTIKTVNGSIKDITDYKSRNKYVEKQEQLPLIEKYNLILFGYNIADIPPAAELTLSQLKNKIADRSKIVSIEGYSDINGDEEYNISLSTERALIVANELGVSESIAVGKGKVKNEIYDNKLPEGRFYSRSVIVTIKQER